MCWFWLLSNGELVSSSTIFPFNLTISIAEQAVKDTSENTKDVFQSQCEDGAKPRQVLQAEQAVTCVTV